jgi:hypothetical protein
MRQIFIFIKFSIETLQQKFLGLFICLDALQCWSAGLHLGLDLEAQLQAVVVA